MSRPILVVLLALASSGCTGFYPVRAPDVAPDATISVTFDTPRDLEARRDTVVYALPAVRKLYGHVEDVRADTLVLRVLEVQSRARLPGFHPRAQVSVVPDPSVHISRRQHSRGRTAGLVAGVTLIGLIALLLANMELGTAVPAQ